MSNINPTGKMQIEQQDLTKNQKPQIIQNQPPKNQLPISQNTQINPNPNINNIFNQQIPNSFSQNIQYQQMSNPISQNIFNHQMPNPISQYQNTNIQAQIISDQKRQQTKNNNQLNQMSNAYSAQQANQIPHSSLFGQQVPQSSMFGQQMPVISNAQQQYVQQQSLFGLNPPNPIISQQQQQQQQPSLFGNQFPPQNLFMPNVQQNQYVTTNHTNYIEQIHGIYNDDQKIQSKEAVKLMNQSKIIFQLRAQKSKLQLRNPNFILPAMCTLKTQGGNRTNVDLICVIDISGSMSGLKIDLVKQTLNYILNQLNQNDRLCLITFNGNGKRLCTLLRNSIQNKPKFQALIKNMQAGGGTSIMAGMNHALKMIKQRKYSNTVTSIFLLSDGQDQSALPGFKNVISSESKSTNYSLHSFGFGNDHDPILMTQFAKLKDGNFYYIRQLTTLDEAFVNALGALFSIVAQNLKITVNKISKGKFGDITIKKTYGPLWKQNKDNYEITLNQLVSEVSKDFVFQLDIPTLNFQIGDLERNQDIVFANYQAYDMKNKKLTGESVLSLIFLNKGQNLQEEDQNISVIENYLRVKAASAIQINMQKAKQKKYKEAKQGIQSMVKEIKSNKKIDQQRMRPLIQDLNKISQTCVQKKFEAQGFNLMNQKKYGHMAQNNFAYSNMNQVSMLNNLQAQKPQNAFNAQNGLFGKKN